MKTLTRVRRYKYKVSREKLHCLQIYTIYIHTKKTWGPNLLHEGGTEGESLEE